MPALPRRVAAPRFGARTLLAFLAFLVAAVPFALLLALVKTSYRPLVDIDDDVATRLHRVALAHPWFADTMRVISDIGKPVVWWAVLTLVAIWLVSRRFVRLASFVAVTAIGSGLLNLTIKAAVDRTRPSLPHAVAVATGKSFPSGHTQAAVVGYGILVLVFLPLVARRLRPLVVAAAVLMVLTIGFSRIALGVHYLSDVVAGLLVGGGWLLAMTAAFSAWRRDEGKPAVHVTEGLEPENVGRVNPRLNLGG